MAVEFLDLKRQYAAMRQELDGALAGVVETQRFILGPVVQELERAVADFSGAAHGVGCASGTDALILALRALELEPGDEVVVPAFTFFATAGAVWNAGLRPVFADVDPDCFDLTADAVQAVLTDRTRAVVPVHLFGQMTEMAPLLELAEAYGLALIEDVAQAFGARQQVRGQWRTAGSAGDAGCFSFFPTKILGGFGDGGLVTTGRPELAARVAKLRVHGGEQMYHHEMVGTNSRLDALQAAVLLAKLRHVPAWIETRRAVAALYDQELAGLAPAVAIPAVRPGNDHVYNLYTIRAAKRDELRAHLGVHGIGTGVYYPVPLHLQACFAGLGYRPGDLPVSERLTGEVLSLPIFPELTPDECREVAGRIREFYGG